MLQLVLAAAAFIALHVLVSGTRLRDALVRRLGEGPYMGLFSLLSVAGLAWLIWAFASARGTPADTEWWSAEPWRKPVADVLVLLAVLLVVPGLLTRNPTSVKSEAAVDREDVVRGMIRITRHPFLWGVAIWAAAHLLTNGDAASVVLFGTMLLLGLVGPPSIDAKRTRTLGARWEPFRTQTSSVPFAAIVDGRQRLSLGEIGGWRIAAALGAYVALVLVHPYAFGADPLR